MLHCLDFEGQVSIFACKSYIGNSPRPDFTSILWLLPHRYCSETSTSISPFSFFSAALNSSLYLPDFSHRFLNSESSLRSKFYHVSPSLFRSMTCGQCLQVHSRWACQTLPPCHRSIPTIDHSQ